MKLTEDQKEALQQVYQMISPDIPNDYSPEEIAELLIDAGRLDIHGFPEVQREMSSLARKDYGETLKLIASELYL